MMTSLNPLLRADELRDTMSEWVLLDVRPGKEGRAAYEKAHLDGAIYVDLDRDLSQPQGNSRGGRHPLPEIKTWDETLRRNGLTPKDSILIYDDQNAAYAAARAWWMLTASGYAHVRVLDGGIRSALEQNLSTSVRTRSVQVSSSWVKKEWARPQVSIADVVELREYPEFRLVDVRSEERFLGIKEPLDPVAGHIPGAINIPYTASLDENGFFLPKHELRKLYCERLKSDQSAKWIIYCGSGVTACHTLLALEVAGLNDASLYVGSWSEWCRSGLPIATNA